MQVSTCGLDVSLYYIIQNIFLCSIIQNVYTFANKIYIHTYIRYLYVPLRKPEYVSQSQFACIPHANHAQLLES